LVKQLNTDRGNQRSAVSKGTEAIKDAASGGWGNVKNNTAYQTARDSYIAAGGRGEDFEARVKNQI
jgi:hypothetical protein